MTKQATIQVRVEQDQKDLLVQMAAKQRVPPSHIYREAIYEYIQAHAPNGLCPECGSAEIEVGEDEFLDRGLCKSLTHRHCADCGTEID